MAGWLRSVGTILEKLDGGVETAVDETGNARAALTSRFLGGGRSSDEEDDDEESYEDEEGDDSYEEEESGEEEEYEEKEENRLGGEKDPPFVDHTSPQHSGTDASNIKKRSVRNHPSEPSPILPTVTETSPAAVTEQLPKPPQPPPTASSSSAPLDPTPNKNNPAQSMRQGDLSKAQASENPPALKSLESKDATTGINISGDDEARTAAAAAVRNESFPSVTQENKTHSPLRRPPPPLPATATTRRAPSIEQLPKRNKTPTSPIAPTPPPSVNVQLQRKLEKANQQLQTQVNALQAELQAQHNELTQAAEQLDVLRKKHKEEQDDLLEEQEEELDSLKADYERQLKEQRLHFEIQLAEMQSRIDAEQDRRAREGGDFTQELQGAVEREREALLKNQALAASKNQLESQVEDLSSEKLALLSQVDGLLAASKAAADRERQAEERLDAALEHHKHQLGQRQTREAELERTVAELGAALAKKPLQTESQDIPGQTAAVSTNGTSYKVQYETVCEELETVQTQLRLSERRCEALTSELEEVSRERTRETTMAQARQRESDRMLSELSVQIKRLESSLHNRRDGGGLASDEGQHGGDLLHLGKEIQDARQQIAALSDQLLRQQGQTESAKSEVLALKGRLETANARAEAAEHQATDTRLYELESGSPFYSTSKTRRRVKGPGSFGGAGSHRPHHLNRSVRSALGLRGARGSAMEQVALTVDALDGFMMDAGGIMRREPLVRVGFAAYLTLLHVWCFGLVFFHAVESEHGDLTTLTHRGGALHPSQLG